MFRVSAVEFSRKAKLTGKQPGSTPLKCLFEGETVSEVFIVDVIPDASRPVGQPSVLFPHAAPYLTGERASHPKPSRKPVAVQRGPQTGIHLQRNHVFHVKRDKFVVRIVLGSSSIVRVVQHSSREFVILGAEPGNTSLLIWSEGEADPELFQVTVLPIEPVVSGNNVLSATGSDQGDAARRQIEEALNKQASIDIVDSALIDAIREIRKTTGVNTAMDIAALEEVGVTTNSKVSLRLSGITLRAVLKILLSELDLAAIIENEVVLVTSRQRAESRQTVIAYRVVDLVEQKTGGADSFDELMTLVTTVVQPESWQKIGGNGSVATNLPTGTLVIRQTDRAHEEIQQLFTALRNWKKTTSSDMKATVPVAEGVDELNGVGFTEFDSIEYSQPPLGVQTPPGGPISTGDDSLREPARRPGHTGAPIEAR